MRILRNNNSSPVGTTGFWMAFFGSLILWTGVVTAQSGSPWLSTAKSSGQHPIEVARFGKGSKNVLIVGSLAGNEPESLTLIDAACALSSQYSPPEGITLLFVRTLNPDGMVDHVHTNSRGVDLNRNFPSRYFTSIPDRLTGPAPASEVETQYMVRILQEYQPVRVVHLRSGMGEHPLILVTEGWTPAGKPAVVPERVSVGLFDRSFKAGSLEEYAARGMNAATATIYLSAPDQPQITAAELLRFVTGNLNPQSGMPPASLAEKASRSESKPTTPSPGIPEGNSVTTSGISPQTRPAEEVEFLPTPPEFLTTGKTDAKSEPSRYFELPPPPHH